MNENLGAILYFLASVIFLIIGIIAG